jgi:hypothetical protein
MNSFIVKNGLLKHQNHHDDCYFFGINNRFYAFLFGKVIVKFILVSILITVIGVKNTRLRVDITFVRAEITVARV